tara:strand:+ start:1122 stop:1397 length:276 start_codon:yes stop_codon:yes gene_type:complete
MPCSHCKGIGHNKRTCPELKKNIIQKELKPQEHIQTQPEQTTITQMIQQQNTEYEKALQQDLQKQKEAELAEPSIQHLRELRLQFFQNGNR